MHRRLPFLVVVALAAACGTSQSRYAHPASPSAAPKSGAAPSSAAAPATRPAEWAQPLSRPGLPNLFRVSDHYYRGAQPTAAGFQQLSKMGVRTDVNLRSMHSDTDKLGSVPIAYQHISFKAWHPEHDDVVRFLKIVTNPANQPVFVHCQHGADRTGMMTAVYRIVVQGWSKDDALDEMTQGGFGYHPIWRDLVDFVRKMDVEALRREVGLPAPAPTH